MIMYPLHGKKQVAYSGRYISANQVRFATCFVSILQDLLYRPLVDTKQSK